MLDILLLLIGLVGFGAASYLDLKTTEFPDWLPYLIIIAALGVRAVFAFVGADLWIFLSSVIIGCIFLGFGLLMYFLKQWGDGDAWLLGTLGFLFPVKNISAIFPSNILIFNMIPFPISILIVFFMVAFVYLLIYSIALGIKSPETIKKFRKNLKGKAKILAAVMIVFLVCYSALFSYLGYITKLKIDLIYIIFFPVFIFGMLIFMIYGKFIEKNIFLKKINVKRLRIGDVPLNEKWRVLKKEEIDKLKKKGGHVWIKQGIRFAPVFLITLVVLFLVL